MPKLGIAPYQHLNLPITIMLLQTKETQWVPPDELVSSILDEKEVQNVVDASNAEYDHERYLESKVGTLQSIARCCVLDGSNEFEFLMFYRIRSTFS